MKYFLLLFGLLVIIFSCSTSKKGDKEKKGLDSIQIENNFPSKAKITQDLMKFAKHDYSFQDIVESANMDIQPHYYLLDSFCLTFVPYKRLLAEAHFKQSAVIVYKKGNKAWIADTIYNFYNDFQQIKDGLPYFESKNSSEIFKGEMSYHYSLAHFKNGKLKEIEKLEGLTILCP
jgi:hypothetical protein